MYQKKVLDYVYSISSFMNQENNTFVTRIHKYPPDSSIYWHNDGNERYGITYYLNNEWDWNWGGELLFHDGTWLAPRKNRLVVGKNGWHKTSRTEKGIGHTIPDRLTLQSFWQPKQCPKFCQISKCENLNGSYDVECKDCGPNAMCNPRMISRNYAVLHV